MQRRGPRKLWYFRESIASYRLRRPYHLVVVRARCTLRPAFVVLLLTDAVFLKYEDEIGRSGDEGPSQSLQRRMAWLPRRQALV